MSLLSIVILTGNALVLSAYVSAIDWKGLYNENEYFRSVDGTLKCTIDKLRKDIEYRTYYE